jgi:rhamnogalacturonan endolyase
MDPNHPGLEVYLCIEPAMKKNGFCQVDAKTGKMLWGVDAETRHGGIGLVADIDPEQPGVELWAGDEDLLKYWLVNAQGKVLSNKENRGSALFWDGDLQREILNRDKIGPYNYASGKVYNTKFPSGTLVQADVLGDWREEVILSVPGELRIYTTTIPARDRRVTLMRDPIYRLDVCEASSGYFSLPAFKVNPR